MASISYPSRLQRRHLIMVVVMVLLLYAVIPQLGAFHASWQLLRKPHPSWVAAAVGLTALTYASAALTYYLLALKPLRYLPTVLVQLAASFINRLLPAGVGALGVNYVYLRRARFSSTQAGSMVAINNLLGIIGHGLVIAATLLVSAGQVNRLSPNLGHPTTLVKLVLGVVIIVVALGLFVARRRLSNFRRDIKNQLAGYRQQPLRLVAALSSSIVLTLTNVLCLACSALALGVHLPFVAILLIFSFGVSAGAVTPTPGGLGGFEAGLVGGLAAYRVGSSEALAVALLYRLISYWLTLATGAVAFVIGRRQLLTA